ncbi:MAG: AAA family ATPase [Candidatus Paceibacterota bacterium]|jgi:ATP-dependent Clp protease ATP-binding subunit ClpC
MDIRAYLKQSPLYDVLVVNSLVSTKTREKINSITKNAIVVILFIMVIYYLVRSSSKFVAFQSFANFIAPILFGLLLINIAVFLFAKLVDIYLSTQYYFEHIIKNRYANDELYTVSAGKILYAGRKTDILHGLFYSRIGKILMFRLGINEPNIKAFVASQPVVREEVMPKQEGNILKLQDIVLHLFNNNKAFQNFLQCRGITEKHLIGALNWVIYMIETKEYRNQWWRPETLARMGGIGRDWSFGNTYLLDKYSRDVMKDEEVSSDAFVISDRETEISQIETALSKSNEANVILVGEAGQEKMQVVWSICRHMRDGKIAVQLKNKKVILLSVNTIVSVCKRKDTLEDQVRKIMNEVLKAGDIILVVDNFPLLLSTAEALGSDMVSLLDPYLASPALQLIAISDNNEYHRVIEPNKSLMARLETVLVRPLSTEENARIIADSTLFIEAQYDIYFTFQAVQELAESAEYYFPDGVSTDKAMDLLNEIAPWSKRQNISYIGRDEVLEYIQEKTKIPTGGKISREEKDKLLNLENILNKKIIGQKEAVTAISNAMRRSRSGIRNPNKPIGSFLFLGPTGVGKTETSKALAEVFFDSVDNMMRLDMSEYQTDDAMERLIGSFTNNRPGVFSSMLRDKPFGVMLLDEFEKTNKNVLNLFLQILDEGFFSDTTGRKVSTKNIIFIATSNAGADTIFAMVNAGKNPKDAKEEILADIIGRGLFKPELINRFDGTIIFKPLEEIDLKQIARIMLKRVAERLIEKGIEFKVTDTLVDYVVKHGANAAFGARPMNRFIQDTVEGNLAELIIKRQILSGNSIEFNVTDEGLLPKIR